ncbi:hypothetical protein F4604DRAFT_1930542 [Suillus subluteus]|nr:hypothetical protein F4604DRAFT_1930542 [Suillus subluteus]
MSNKPVHVDQTVVKWTEPILLYVVLNLIFPARIEKYSRPCEPSSEVQISVYASFELGPMLSHREVLRTFETSVQELLDRSENSHAVIFQPKQEEVVSLCTSLFMTLERRLSDENDAAFLCPFSTPTSSNMDELVVETDTGHRLHAQYCRTQTSGDLDQSIKHFEQALDICPMGHPCRPAALFNLTTAKFVDCQVNETHPGHDPYIPIALFQGTLDLHYTDHLDRTVTQLHLAIALLYHFMKMGFQTDADAAEELLNEVLNVCHANSHIYRAALIAIETSALRSARSIHANDPGEERPTTSMPPLSPHQLSHRAQWCLQRDEPRALDEVISLHYDALGYYNTGHDVREQLLCNLGILLETCFRRRGNDEDMDQAVAFQRESLALCPVGHTDRSMRLYNLAVQLASHFEHQGNDEDLEQAIALQREVLALWPVGRTARSTPLITLQINSPPALNTEAIEKTSMINVHGLLTTVYLSFHHLGLDGTSAGEDTDSLHVAMHHLKVAANVVSAGLLPRLQASLSWVSHAFQHSHDTELEAYATSIQLLDAFMSTTASVSSRHAIMKALPSTFAVDAASHVLHHGDMCRTVEFLQTRGDHAAALVKQFRDLSSLLSKPPTNDRDATSRVDVEAEETRYRHSVKDWNGAVEEIRKIEGFFHFLLPPLFSDLQGADYDGPIIMLITSKSSCDAIIIPHKQPPTSI